MQKLSKWLDKHLLELGVCLLLFFIPLYPKFPLLDIRHTWVYIRAEDFLVALIVGLWLVQLARKKVSLKTPLTFPILAYWLVGLVSLLHAIFILSSRMLNFFPHLAWLHYFRRVEYMILFFVAAATVKDLRVIKKYLWVIGATLFFVCLYGFGQKFLGFPAFLTMNEEFAKGLPLFLPPTARMTATFAGHYDLAAFLVLMIAFWASLIFGLHKRLAKVFAFLLVWAAFILLLFTASRISFAVYLVAITYVLFLQKKYWLIIPVVVLSLFLSRKVTGSSDRFGKTFRVQRVVYDTRTGRPIATVEEFFATPTPTPTPPPPVEIVAKKKLAPAKPAPPAPPKEEEDLPLGSGFLSLEGLTKEEAKAQIIRKILKTATVSAQMATTSGEFLIKRAIVYDISFTTRFQGQWPRALEAFGRNKLLGSGFSAISLATDNDYLRLLGETGLLGLFSFLAILAVFSLLVKHALAKITQPLPRSILIGTLAGVLGLALNAVLIDVFEASKVAYFFWLLLGIVVGLVQFVLPKEKSLLKEAFAVAKSPLTTVVGLIFLTALIFGSGLKNYFVGDDFTWLRWALSSAAEDIPQFFLNARGFFYRPLAKLYFYQVSVFFGLRPYGYHLISLLIHFGCAVAAYFLALLLTKKRLLSTLIAFLFLIHPINSESIFWISTTSHLFASFFYLWGMVAYLQWRQVKNGWRWLFYVLAIFAYILGLVSHERMITFPLAILLYDLIFYQFKKAQSWAFKVAPWLPFWIFVDVYLWLRNNVAQAHGLSGDYNYNLKNLPFNLVGNTLGYLGELVASFHFIPVYDAARGFLRFHKVAALGLLLLVIFAVKKIFVKINIKQSWPKREFKLAIFGLGWFLVLLLPFLGLGNIAERYVYPAHLGFFLIIGLVFNWLFQKLRRTKPSLALVVVGAMVAALASFYLWESEKAKKDWYDAGETANKILLTLASNYDEFPLESHLYFVDVPLRYRRAWVFPVGLKDALWFIYRDDSLMIDQVAGLEQTLKQVEKKEHTHVFVFEDGELKEARLKIIKK